MKLRVAVARFGERDNARWWNTDGQLGSIGEIVLKRNFPRSYRFAAARSVFAVARARCNEVFNPPASMTLWNLPAVVEDQFDATWELWIDKRAEWEPFFARVAEIRGSSDLSSALTSLELVAPEDLDALSKLKRSAEGRAVQVGGTHAPADDILRLLALGFSKGEAGSLTIPYARLDS